MWGVGGAASEGRGDERGGGCGGGDGDGGDGGGDRGGGNCGGGEGEGEGGRVAVQRVEELVARLWWRRRRRGERGDGGCKFIVSKLEPIAWNGMAPKVGRDIRSRQQRCEGHQHYPA